METEYYDVACIEMAKNCAGRNQWWKFRFKTDTVSFHKEIQYLFSNKYSIKTQEMQQYADIYLLQSYSTCFGCHSTHHQEY